MFDNNGCTRERVYTETCVLSKRVNVTLGIPKNGCFKLKTCVLHTVIECTRKRYFHENGCVQNV